MKCLQFPDFGPLQQEDFTPVLITEQNILLAHVNAKLTEPEKTAGCNFLPYFVGHKEFMPIYVSPGPTTPSDSDPSSPNQAIEEPSTPPKTSNKRKKSGDTEARPTSKFSKRRRIIKNGNSDGFAEPPLLNTPNQAIEELSTPFGTSNKRKRSDDTETIPALKSSKRRRVIKNGNSLATSPVRSNSRMIKSFLKPSIGSREIRNPPSSIIDWEFYALRNRHKNKMRQGESIIVGKAAGYLLT
jgi:hypothetical protein